MDSQPRSRARAEPDSGEVTTADPAANRLLRDADYFGDLGYRQEPVGERLYSHTHSVPNVSESSCLRIVWFMTSTVPMVETTP
jgi:hypothetical protein